MATRPVRRFLPLREVLARVGCARSTLYAWAEAGDFPAPIRLSQRRNAWDELEVAKWQESRLKARDEKLLEAEELRRNIEARGAPDDEPEAA